ncbi:right-handed parallel beta-helix repeat-containing protein [Streptomyces sp. NBC_01433]|uniref:right-handed parallel beta-helix repeat-containing protein n=1 Tax=Streptomyces sp. NBC_01433 TaxID=2903864 RepID=UPI0022511810|nr:right-handed parallel beta-helix repeat-containing protein [Streptomyces sp. NBC_01433]MCX4681267.1 right-handed parallel beta-helix repeat-containing protein [Streptomyces sp. NBC_01433]
MALVLTGATAALAPATAQAAVACTETALVSAINAANTAGGGNVVLAANCTYTITTSHSSDSDGPNALPVITTAITLTGDTDTITRSTAPGTAAFRIAKVAATGSLTLKGNTTLNNGNAATNGGGILNYGAVTLTASALTGNSAQGRGGALANADITAPATGASATFTNSTVSGNSAMNQGGGIYNGTLSSLTTTSSAVKNNTSTAAGGGIAAVNSTATTLTSTPVSANHAQTAGGVYRQNGTITLTTSPISGNTPNNCVGSVPSVPGCTA